MFSVNDKGQVTFNGKPVNEMTEEERKKAYGSAGDIGAGIAQSFDFTTGARPNFEFDPKYYEKYDIISGDAGVIGSGYRLKPEYSRMQGMAQVGIPRSLGGMGEPVDPSLITYDEEFGYITPLSNIKEPRASGLSGFLESYLPYMLAAGMGAAIATTGGFAGLGIAGGGEAGAAGIGEGLGIGEGIAGGAGATPTGGIVTGAAETGALGTAPVAASTAGIGGGGLEVSEAMRGILSQGTAAGGSAASTAANAAIQQGVQTLGGVGAGGIGSWFSSLSSPAQRAILSAAGQGASAIIGQQRQSSAQEFARQQQEVADQRRQEEAERQRQFAREQQDLAYQRRLEEEQRAAEERRIRGTPSAFTFNVTPRAGIIRSGMGG